MSMCHASWSSLLEKWLFSVTFVLGTHALDEEGEGDKRGETGNDAKGQTSSVKEMLLFANNHVWAFKSLLAQETIVCTKGSVSVKALARAKRRKAKILHVHMEANAKLLIFGHFTGAWGKVTDSIASIVVSSVQAFINQGLCVYACVWTVDKREIALFSGHITVVFDNGHHLGFSVEALRGFTGRLAHHLSAWNLHSFDAAFKPLISGQLIIASAKHTSLIARVVVSKIRACKIKECHIHSCVILVTAGRRVDKNGS